MRNTRRSSGITAGRLAVLCAAVGVTALVPATAQAEETTCRGTIGAQTVDNLRVPDGAACTLNGTRVQGTVKVESAATLRAKDVRVIGNVQGENAQRVNVVEGSKVGGSVQVVQGTFAKVKESRVKADILYDENTGRVSALSNRVGGNIQAFKNTGGVEIATNRVDGNLQCKENEPAPTGGGNVVQGNKEDQCASL
jgi:hypothetical protein